MGRGDTRKKKNNIRISYSLEITGNGEFRVGWGSLEQERETKDDPGTLPVLSLGKQLPDGLCFPGQTAVSKTLPGCAVPSGFAAVSAAGRSQPQAGHPQF